MGLTLLSEKWHLEKDACTKNNEDKDCIMAVYNEVLQIVGLPFGLAFVIKSNVWLKHEQHNAFK